MNLKEEFAQKSAELKSLETRISEGEVELSSRARHLPRKSKSLARR